MATARCHGCGKVKNIDELYSVYERPGRYLPRRQVYYCKHSDCYSAKKKSTSSVAQIKKQLNNIRHYSLK